MNSPEVQHQQLPTLDHDHGLWRLQVAASTASCEQRGQLWFGSEGRPLLINNAHCTRISI